MCGVVCARKAYRTPRRKNQKIYPIRDACRDRSARCSARVPVVGRVKRRGDRKSRDASAAPLRTTHTRSASAGFCAISPTYSEISLSCLVTTVVSHSRLSSLSVSLRTRSEKSARRFIFMPAGATLTFVRSDAACDCVLVPCVTACSSRVCVCRLLPVPATWQFSTVSETVASTTRESICSDTACGRLWVTRSSPRNWLVLPAPWQVRAATDLAQDVRRYVCEADNAHTGTTRCLSAAGV